MLAQFHHHQQPQAKNVEDGWKEIETESSSVSPYEHLAAQLRVAEQRQGRPSITHFVLDERKEQIRASFSRDCFVIQEENEENSMIVFGEDKQRLSTIQYRQGTAFPCQDMESSDILIKEWIVSSEKVNKISKAMPRTTFLHQNRNEEQYVPSKAIIFNTKLSYMHEIDQSGHMKRIQTPEIRKGIRLVLKQHCKK